MHEIERHTPSRLDDARRDEMKTPEDVTAMARLKSSGWGAKRIAVELGCSKNTVKRWLREGAWRSCSTISRSKRRRVSSARSHGQREAMGVARSHCSSRSRRT